MMENIKREPNRVVVIFKSSNIYFDKEESGLKPNTVREVDLSDERFHLLREWETTEKYGFIGIRHSEYNKSFYRKITDISSFKNMIIISWKHEEVKK